MARLKQTYRRFPHFHQALTDEQKEIDRAVYLKERQKAIDEGQTPPDPPLPGHRPSDLSFRQSVMIDGTVARIPKELKAKDLLESYWFVDEDLHAIKHFIRGG